MTRPANETGTRAILRALAGILERAAALHAKGCDPMVAIRRAAAAERASLALYDVARRAWVLALPPDDSGPAAPAVTSAPPPRTSAGERIASAEQDHAPQVASVAWGPCS